MEKNENGYPITRGATNAPETRNDSHQNRTNCGNISADSIDARPLAYVYAPSQRFCMLYSAEDALSHGTLFEALYKPMEVYGRE